MTKTRVQNAICCSEAGYTIIKLKGKIPPKDYRWSKQLYTPSENIQDEFDNWQFNYGVALKEGEIVLDIDPRNFVCVSCKKTKDKCDCLKFEEDKPHKRLFEEAGIDIKDYATIVKTGGKRPGMHCYLKMPYGSEIKVMQKAYPGIDFKREGGYVAAVGSIHPDTGTEYKLMNGLEFNEIKMIPAKLLEIISREKPSVATDKALDFEGTTDDDLQIVDSYIEFLRQTDPAVE